MKRPATLAAIVAAIIAAAIIAAAAFIAGHAAGVIHAATTAEIDVFPTYSATPGRLIYVVALNIDGNTYTHEAEP